jgi:hypothetical protein
MALKELDANPELRDDPSLKDIPDVVTLAKTYRDTKAFVGSSIRPPGPDASPEAKADFYKKLMQHAPDLVPLRDNDAEADKIVWKKLGRPDKPEEYTYELPKDGPAVDLEALRAVAVETGMTKAQFKKAADKAVALAQKNAADTDADSKALKTEWGQAYESKLAQAAEAAAKLGAPPAVAEAIKAGRVSSATAKLWANVAKSIGAETTIVGKQEHKPAGSVLTPAEAEAQIHEIMNNPLFLNRNGGGPARGALAEVRRAAQVSRRLTKVGYLTSPTGVK